MRCLGVSASGNDVPRETSSGKQRGGFDARFAVKAAPIMQNEAIFDVIVVGGGHAGTEAAAAAARLGARVALVEFRPRADRDDVVQPGDRRARQRSSDARGRCARRLDGARRQQRGDSLPHAQRVEGRGGAGTARPGRSQTLSRGDPELARGRGRDHRRRGQGCGTAAVGGWVRRRARSGRRVRFECARGRACNRGHFSGAGSSAAKSGWRTAASARPARTDSPSNCARPTCRWRGSRRGHRRGSTGGRSTGRGSRSSRRMARKARAGPVPRGTANGRCRRSFARSRAPMPKPMRSSRRISIARRFSPER